MIIPAWRADPAGRCWLDEALDSVRAQTFADWELIVVDDGSPVPIAPACTDDVVLVRQRNTGPGGARNTGTALARGELVAYLDSDDRWRPHKLERQVKLHQQRPELGLSATNFIRIDTNSRREPARHDLKPSYREIRFEELVIENCVPCSSTMVRRSAVARTPGMATHRRLGEDYGLWLRLAITAPIGYLGEALTEHRIHAGSLTQQHQRAGATAALEREVYADLLVDFPGLRNHPHLRAGLARVAFDEGWLRLQRQEWRDARQALLQSLQLDPMRAKVWINLVRAIVGETFALPSNS